jgi:hypothetical protein
MTIWPKALALAAIVAVSPMPARAEASLTAYEASRAALLAIWDELPLTIRNVALTEGAPGGYGDYTVHEGNSFKPGETIHIYAEVLGYGWRDNGDGTVSKLLDADLALVDASGATVASKQGFVTTDVRSREKLLESDLAFNVTLTAFQPGAYKLQFTVHDRASGKDAVFDVPVTLLAADAPVEPSTSSEAPPAETSSSTP